MKYFYPLLENTLSKQDLNAGIKVIKSEQLTMSKKTVDFEKQFAKKLGKICFNGQFWIIR